MPSTLRERLMVAITLLVFFTTVSLIPLANKDLVLHARQNHRFPYPLLLSLIQLIFCGVATSLWGFFEWLVRSAGRQQSEPSPEHSHHRSFLSKIGLIFPAGFFFGLKLSVTNWGLLLLPVGTHVLLQAADPLFTVVFARAINGERLSLAEALCCAGTMCGTALLMIRVTVTLPSYHATTALILNFTSPVLLGLTVAYLRRAARVLLVDEVGHSKSSRGTTVVELTAIKLWISAITVVPFFLYFESGSLVSSELGLPAPPDNPLLGVPKNPEAGWKALVSGGSRLYEGLFISSVLVCAFQLNIVLMSKLLTAVTIGIAGGVKVLPQWLIAKFTHPQSDESTVHLLGAATITISAIGWAALRGLQQFRDIEDEERKLVIEQGTKSGISAKQNLYGTASTGGGNDGVHHLLNTRSRYV